MGKKQYLLHDVGGERGDGVGFGSLVLLTSHTAGHGEASNESDRVQSLHGEVREVPAR